MQFCLDISQSAIAYFVEKLFPEALFKMSQILVPEVSSFLQSVQLGNPLASTSTNEPDSLRKSASGRSDASGLLDVSTKIPSSFFRYFTQNTSQQIGGSMSADTQILGKVSEDSLYQALTRIKRLADLSLMLKDYKKASLLYEIILKKLIPISHMKSETIAKKFPITETMQYLYNQSLTRFILSLFFLAVPAQASTTASATKISALKGEDLKILLQNSTLLLDAVKTLSDSGSDSPKLAYLQQEYFFQFYIYSMVLLETNGEDEYVNFIYSHLYHVPIVYLCRQVLNLFFS